MKRGQVAGRRISDLQFQMSGGKSVAIGVLQKKGVNIFVFVWMRKEASRSDSGRQEATGKGANVRKAEKRGYNGHARKVGMVMKREGAIEKDL